MAEISLHHVSKSTVCHLGSLIYNMSIMTYIQLPLNQLLLPTPFRYAVWECFAFYSQTTSLQVAAEQERYAAGQ